MDFPSRRQPVIGDNRLSASQKEIFGYYKLPDEERKPFDQSVSFEDVKDPDILLDRNSAEDTAQSVRDHQKEVKIEEEPDVDGSDVSTLKGADLLNDSDDKKKPEVHKIRNQMSRKRKHVPTHSSRLLFDCPAENCLLSFGSFEELKEHVIMSHSDEEGSVCDVCTKVFHSIDEAMEHYRKREKIGCCACGKWFAHRITLMKHLRIHVGMEGYSCAFCGRRFTQKIHLERHEISHTVQKSVSCGYCGLKLHDLKSLIAHERIHEEDKRSMEQFYQNTGNFKQDREKAHQFIQNGDLESHTACCVTKVEQNEKKIDDELRLDISTSASATLNAADLLGDSVEVKEDPIESTDRDDVKKDEKDSFHDDEIKGCEEHVSSDEDNRIHTEEKPYSCGHCEKRFARRSDIKRHESTHEKPLECSHCGKKFNDRSSLDNHIHLHITQKTFSCEKCDEKFSRNYRLQEHMKKIHHY